MKESSVLAKQHRYPLGRHHIYADLPGSAVFGRNPNIDHSGLFPDRDLHIAFPPPPDWFKKDIQKNTKITIIIIVGSILIHHGVSAGA